MDTQSYQTARAKVPIEQLRQFSGQWVAFSEDGSRIVAAATDILELDQLVVAAGEDPERVGIDHVMFDDASYGGAEAL